MDDAWRDLIHGKSHLSSVFQKRSDRNTITVDAVDLIGSEADTVRDTTLKKDSGHSIVGIDGFHQIHFLVCFLPVQVSTYRC
jgi:hypothetical protein